MTIADWPAAERPRERLLALGPGALSDAELIALFLRTGARGKSALDLARELLSCCGGLSGLLGAGGFRRESRDSALRRRRNSARSSSWRSAACTKTFTSAGRSAHPRQCAITCA
jgi:hypothetical protein